MEDEIGKLLIQCIMHTSEALSTLEYTDSVSDCLLPNYSCHRFWYSCEICVRLKGVEVRPYLAPWTSVINKTKLNWINVFIKWRRHEWNFWYKMEWHLLVVSHIVICNNNFPDRHMFRRGIDRLMNSQRKKSFKYTERLTRTWCQINFLIGMWPTQTEIKSFVRIHCAYEIPAIVGGGTDEEKRSECRMLTCPNNLFLSKGLVP